MLVKTLDSKVKELGIPIYPEPGAAQVLLSYIQNRQQAVPRVIPVSYTHLDVYKRQVYS